MSSLKYVIALMVGYDALLHLLFLVGIGQRLDERGIRVWPEHDTEREYDLFWSVYWGLCLLLVLVELF